MKNYSLVKPTAFSMMAKPMGAYCNLGCSYCYYLEKYKLSDNIKMMPDDILELYIKQLIEAHEVPIVQFVWHGGEPLLAPISYYEKIIQLQAKYSKGKRIENILQTNATLINDEWALFFHKNNFLIGVSIDGPAHLHNEFRFYSNGDKSWDKVMNGINILKKISVEFNTMTTINKVNANYPLEVYRFLKDIGSKYMQFLPVVEVIDNSENAMFNIVPATQDNAFMVSDWSVSPGAFGEFLIAIFNEWVRKDVGNFYIQHFDVALANWVNYPAGLCVYSEVCGDAGVIEVNGDVYSCDHFVFPEYKLGNIREKSLRELMLSPKQIEFGMMKVKDLAAKCIDCDYRFACNGGCLKHRIKTKDTPTLPVNYLCKGYYRFFEHIHPYMQFMADELNAKRAPANVMDWVKKRDFRNSIRGNNVNIVENINIDEDINELNRINTSPITNLNRNDLCFCGSGKKFKNCCNRIIQK